MKNSFLGKVVSKKTQKTIKVLIPRRVKDEITGKYLNRHTTCLVHDEFDLAKQNDIVQISPSKPFSKRKCWILLSVVTAIAR